MTWKKMQTGRVGKQMGRCSLVGVVKLWQGAGKGGAGLAGYSKHNRQPARYQLH